MTKKTLAWIAAAALMAACNGKTTNDNSEAANDGTSSTAVATTSDGKSQKMRLDSAYYHKEEGIVKCILMANLPAERMNQPVGEWLDEVLGGLYPADPTDIQGIVDFYGQAMYDSLKTMEADVKANEIPCTELAYEMRMNHEYETEQFVTYTLTIYTYYGGAHPSWISQGATFRKKDGRRIGWDFIASTYSYPFEQRVKKGLMEYFEVKTDEELNEQLQVNTIYSIPLPVTPPYFTEKGVAVTYQQYEIAAYAMGLPSMVIGYDELKPWMTGWAKRLVK
jgi:hypothetical protein